MACSGAFATAEDYEALFTCGPLTAGEAEGIETTLALVASNVHAVLAQTEACGCTLASWATPYLAKLNVIEAALTGQCNCGSVRFTPEEKRELRKVLQGEYDRILKGEIDVCEGGTGKGYPVADTIEMGLTDFSRRRLVLNRLQRTS